MSQKFILIILPKLPITTYQLRPITTTNPHSFDFWIHIYNKMELGMVYLFRPDTLSQDIYM